MNIELQVLGSALRAVAEEMGAVLIRSAFSANIKERRDCSTALFDGSGRLIAQAEHIPVHLGAMPDAVAAVLREDPRPRRHVRPQRPVHRRHAPAGHHARLAHRPRLRRHACPPRRRRRDRAGQHARLLAHARRRGRCHPADPARRRRSPRPRRADAEPRGAPRRLPRPARGPAARARTRRRALRAPRPGADGRGDGRAPRLFGARRPGGDRAAPRRALRGGRRPRAGRGRALHPRSRDDPPGRAGDRLRRHLAPARRQPQLPDRSHPLRLLLRRPLPDRSRHPSLRRRLRARHRPRPRGLPRQRPAPGTRSPPATSRPRAASSTPCSALSATRSTCPPRARGR